MDQILSLLSDTIPKAQTLEQLTRPLLALLSQVTGMESTYLTTIDTDEGVQRIEFARNVGEMVIPEGLVVPWTDTLCKRALDENRCIRITSPTVGVIRRLPRPWVSELT